jgi:tetratricopeptide (TPR) repeat protein
MSTDSAPDVQLEIGHVLFMDVVGYSKLAEAHLALGQCMYWIDQDYNRALVEFDTASRLSPNNSEAGGLIAAIKRRQGKWQESLDSYQKISKLDPQNPNIARNLVFTQTALRLWPEAARERLLNTPGAVDSVVYSITVNDLKYRWEWDPIRNDPRFQKLVNAKP